MGDTEEAKAIELKATFGTYLRLFGTAAADVVSVIAIYQAVDWTLATLLSVLIVVVTAWAAWKNNSVTVGAIAADAMKDVLADAANVETVTGTWKEVQATAGAVYSAIKEKTESAEKCD